MKKIEFSCSGGLEFVDQFGDRTLVLHNKILSVYDLLIYISRPFDGVIGWDASDDDLAVLKDAGYLK